MFQNFIFNAQHLFLALRDQPKPLEAPIADLLPFGLPETQEDKSLIYIYRHGYISAYDPVHLVPRWVCWRLSSDNIDKLTVPRRDCFERDVSLVSSSMPSSYDNSGFDLGHMCDCEDMSYSVLSQRESFILSNIAPQAPHFNRGVWGKLERATRVAVRLTKQDHWILAASVYDKSCPMLNGDIVIPNAFEKLIVNTSTLSMKMYNFPHTSPWLFRIVLKITRFKISQI